MQAKEFFSPGLVCFSVPRKVTCFSLMQKWHGIRNDPKGTMRSWKSETVASFLSLPGEKMFLGCGDNWY